MAVTVIMPRQGQSVETCIMGQWHKEVGDVVKTGDLLFSYETDKAAFDEEAKADGILLAKYYETGDEVAVLVPVAIIGEAGEEVPAFEAEEPLIPAEAEEAPKVVEFEVEEGVVATGRIHISPLARNVAREKGINPEKIRGTGPGGRIIVRDIEAAVREEDKAQIPKSPVSEVVSDRLPAETPVSATIAGGGDFEVKPLTPMRKLIARAMHASLQNSAQLTHHLGADARSLLAARKRCKADFESGRSSENVTINDLVCYAVIKALKKFPQVNSHYLGDSIKYFSKVHLGLAVDTDRGLMVPVLPGADDFSLTGLSVRLQQLAADCRKGSVNPDLLRPEAATFTVSNLGNYGVEVFTPVINLPQTAILGVCAITLRPKELGDGAFGFVPHIGLSLTYDHRALDGGEATRFLAVIKNEIENLQL